MFQNRSANVHDFAMVPRADIPRSSFTKEHAHKTTFDAGYLIPIFLDELLPGDSMNLNMTGFARMVTPIFPVMDNVYMDAFFFVVPNRLVWNNWQKFCGEQDNPGDSISYVIPTLNSAAGGFPISTVFDYFGLPTVGQVAGAGVVNVNVLPLRAYNLIWNQWFRDENLQSSATVTKADSGDAVADFTLRKRGKRHDYFTGCLPSPQKFGAVSLPLGTSAPVYGDGRALGLTDGVDQFGMYATAGAVLSGSTGNVNQPVGTAPSGGTFGANKGVGVVSSSNSGLYADLSGATAATINQIRQAFQIQKFLERDMRGGTRYTEKILSHFGVRSPDARLQRPEYIGGGSCRIKVSPIAQTSGTSASGTTTPLGQLAAMATGLLQTGASYHATEHAYVIGLISVRADLTYQQGLRRLWTRSTEYDFYWPAFATLGEQAVYQREIYSRGDSGDSTVFGYQERWAEYRYFPSQITGLFRSTSAGTLDPWHLAQKFTSAPTLNSTFIEESPPVSRVVAVGSGANGAQFYFDSLFTNRMARPMPMYSVPGLIDHF